MLGVVDVADMAIPPSLDLVDSKPTHSYTPLSDIVGSKPTHSYSPASDLVGSKPAHLYLADSCMHYFRKTSVDRAGTSNVTRPNTNTNISSWSVHTQKQQK